MPEKQVDHFDEQVGFVLLYEHEEDANDALLDVEARSGVRDSGALAFADLQAVWKHNAARCRRRRGPECALDDMVETAH